MTSTATETHSTQYFDLHTHGVGYVNRIREVPVKRGDSFWACDIAALHGAEDAVEYTRFDCRVSGTEAAQIIKRLHKAGQEEKKILIGFKLGDLYPDLFTYKSGDKAGRAGVSLKARLLFISWVKVAGDTVYTAPPKAEPVKDSAENPPVLTSAMDMTQAQVPASVQ